MMIQINLLPWREQARKENRIRFFVQMSTFIGISLFCLVILHIIFSLKFSAQQKLNNYLEDEINQEQNLLSDSTVKQDQKKSLEMQLRFIINLHKINIQAIQLLNELTILVSRNISLNKIIKIGNKIILMGAAKSNADLTLFKNDLAKSKIFNQLVLTDISSEKGVSATNFTLEMVQRDIL
jgi:type IV pilus assembly protein PilN